MCLVRGMPAASVRVVVDPEERSGSEHRARRRDCRDGRALARPRRSVRLVRLDELLGRRHNGEQRQIDLDHAGNGADAPPGVEPKARRGRLLVAALPAHGRAEAARPRRHHVEQPLCAVGGERGRHLEALARRAAADSVQGELRHRLDTVRRPCHGARLCHRRPRPALGARCPDGEADLGLARAHRLAHDGRVRVERASPARRPPVRQRGVLLRRPGRAESSRRRVHRRGRREEAEDRRPFRRRPWSRQHGRGVGIRRRLDRP